MVCNGWKVSFILAYLRVRLVLKRNTIQADTTKVWANGHKEVKLTIQLEDSAGQPISDQQILINADPSIGVEIEPVDSDATDANGEVSFTATSTEVNLVKFSATAATDSSLTDSVDIDFQRHKIVVQFLGIRTYLQCNTSTGECLPNFPPDLWEPVDIRFDTIRTLLMSKGFENTDLLWYSYAGGIVDRSTGQWKANSYDCQSTGQNYSTDVALLRTLLYDFAENNPNTDFYLLGHSQGGLIAFQALGLVNRYGMPSNAQIGGIITLDSPLGGSPPEHTLIPSLLPCWRGPAALQLNQLYRTVPNPYKGQQGTYAQLLCSLPGIGLCNFDTNAVAATRALTYTFGNLDDAVFHPSVCPIGSGRIQIRGDNSSSQVVATAHGGLSSMGGKDPLLGTSRCISNSHAQVFLIQARTVANIIGKQIGTP